MELKTYAKSEGGMWGNTQKTKDTQPDWRGHIEVSSAQLRELLDMAKANQLNPNPEFKLKLQLASWVRTAKATGVEYFYLSGEVYNPPAEGQSQQQAPRPSPAPVQMIDDHLDDKMLNAHKSFDDEIPF